MKNSPTIQLSDYALGDEGCRVLVEFLKSHNHDHINRLDLKANNIGEKGILYLAQFL